MCFIFISCIEGVEDESGSDSDEPAAGQDPEDTPPADLHDPVLGEHSDSPQAVYSDSHKLPDGRVDKGDLGDSGEQTEALPGWHGLLQYVAEVAEVIHVGGEGKKESDTEVGPGKGEQEEIVSLLPQLLFLQKQLNQDNIGDDDKEGEKDGVGPVYVAVHLQSYVSCPAVFVHRCYRGRPVHVPLLLGGCA